MKKMINNFAVSGFVAVDAQVHQFESTGVARFPLSISHKETVNGKEVRKSALINAEAWRKKENMADFELLKKGNLVTSKVISNRMNTKIKRTKQFKKSYLQLQRFT